MKELLYFAGGVAIGAAISYLYCKRVYDAQIKEDRDSIKESFENLYKNHGEYIHHEEDTQEEPTQDETPAQVAAKFARHKDSISKYLNKTQELGYSGTSEVSDEDLQKAKEQFKPPYIISEEDFGEDDRQCIGVFYYSDGILAEDNDDVIEDIANTVGQSALDYLNNSDEFNVYVRNERLGVDYEVMYDVRKYADIAAIKNRQKED